ncbi:putative NADPH-dependent methylglyoxal reductase GRP2 [Candida viswanathii]|uniref:Putative NADPH-dependent methylglyoxal reductase GRP2 n=1 Tax=Candida viswanathii TaxID=5486 RepID=A0A367XM01_9ASCO|nr:putative NADPH-dependent methylglyoxal reductase GRP2 [Candida viswanathii]
MSSTTTVFVSGATGFIAQHIVKELLANGYKVIGSVRSEAKGEELTQSINSKDFSYVVVPDISAPGAFDEALKEHPEVTVFIHAASPVVFQIIDPKKDVLDPAIEGTKNVLSAIKQYGTNITRLVVTSSLAAVTPGKDFDKNKTYTEEDWNPVTIEIGLSNPAKSYAASKTFAEKAVWDFVKNENPKFKVSTVLPTFVFGPQAYGIKDKSKLTSLSELLAGIFRSKAGDTYPEITGTLIDVRDVAKAHLVGFENDDAVNKRLVLVNVPYTPDLVAHTIKKNFPDFQGPDGDLVKSDKLIEETVAKINTTKTKEILGFGLTPLETSIIDAYKQFNDA